MKVETPILKRLGPIPFWRGRERCLDSLESIYRRAAEKARRAQWVLRNDTDDLDALKAQVEEVLAAIRRDGQAGSK